jgi:hypothetical protein
MIWVDSEQIRHLSQPDHEKDRRRSPGKVGAGVFEGVTSTARRAVGAAGEEATQASAGC